MKKKIMYACGIAAACLLLFTGMSLARTRVQALPWYEKYPMVCHALGQTKEGDIMTNSKDAFLYNYSLGGRVFEADIRFTSDGVMVLRHDWDSDLGQAADFGWTEEEQWAVTAREFLEAPIDDKYKPMLLEDWFAIMDRYPDIYFVTDTKYSATVKEDFRIFVDTAVKNGYEDVLSRVIVQIYYKEMYDEVMSVYDFEHVIWTLYYIDYPGGQEVLDFMAEKSIPVLTVQSSLWNDNVKMQRELRDSDIKIFVHTVNDEGEGRRRINQGVDGIYSDRIVSGAVRQWLRSRQAD